MKVLLCAQGCRSEPPLRSPLLQLWGLLLRCRRHRSRRLLHKPACHPRALRPLLLGGRAGAGGGPAA